MERVETVLRVERGQAREDELAALATALLVVRKRAQKVAEQPPVVVPRWERRPKGYSAPGSWR